MPPSTSRKNLRHCGRRRKYGEKYGRIAIPIKCNIVLENHGAEAKRHISASCFLTQNTGIHLEGNILRN
jgi:hypothetical protein